MNPLLPKVHMTLEQVKAIFGHDEIRAIDHIQFCPGWGDALMNPEILPMIDYLFETACETGEPLNLQIITNGSLRSEEWWFELGKTMKYFSDMNPPNLSLNMTFDIDGITQEMHAKYRRGTDLNRVLENMEMCSSFPLTFATSQSVIFEHNYHHMSAIETMAKKFGSISHSFIRSERFDNPLDVDDPDFKFKNEDGKLEYLTMSPPLNTGFREEMTEEIDCRYAGKNEIKINYDGQVLPCCYFTNAYIAGERWSSFDDAGQWKESWIAKEYLKNKMAHNAFERPLLEIISDEWWTKKLPFSWKHENKTALQCVKHCSAKNGTFRVGPDTL